MVCLDTPAVNRFLRQPGQEPKGRRVADGGGANGGWDSGLAVSGRRPVNLQSRIRNLKCLVGCPEAFRNGVTVPDFPLLFLLPSSGEFLPEEDQHG